MAILLPALIGAGLYKIYHRKRATLKEETDLSQKGDCSMINERTPAGPGKRWVPFTGGLLRRTAKCALCPEKAVSVELHRIGNNECVGGSDRTAVAGGREKKTEKRTRVKYERHRAAGGGETRYYKIARDGTKTRLKRDAFIAGKERQAGCDMAAAKRSSKRNKKTTRGKKRSS